VISPTPSTDPPVQAVAALNGAHARGDPAIDQVARRQGEQAGEIGDDLRHLPNHLVELPVLAAIAANLQPDRAALGMADVGGWHLESVERNLLQRRSAAE
jgi:hypothetical protein